MSDEIGRLIRVLIQQECEKLFVPELKAAHEEIARRTLTDVEREALWFAVAYAQNAGHECEATLRGLLERMA